MEDFLESLTLRYPKQYTSSKHLEHLGKKYYSEEKSGGCTPYMWKVHPKVCLFQASDMKRRSNLTFLLVTRGS